MPSNHCWNNGMHVSMYNIMMSLMSDLLSQYYHKNSRCFLSYYERGTGCSILTFSPNTVKFQLNFSSYSHYRNQYLLDLSIQFLWCYNQLNSLCNPTHVKKSGYNYKRQPSSKNHHRWNWQPQLPVENKRQMALHTQRRGGIQVSRSLWT